MMRYGRGVPLSRGALERAVYRGTLAALQAYAAPLPAPVQLAPVEAQDEAAQEGLADAVAELMATLDEVQAEQAPAPAPEPPPNKARGELREAVQARRLERRMDWQQLADELSLPRSSLKNWYAGAASARVQGKAAAWLEAERRMADAVGTAKADADVPLFIGVDYAMQPDRCELVPAPPPLQAPAAAHAAHHLACMRSADAAEVAQTRPLEPPLPEPALEPEASPAVDPIEELRQAVRARMYRCRLSFAAAARQIGHLSPASLNNWINGDASPRAEQAARAWLVTPEPVPPAKPSQPNPAPAPDTSMLEPVPAAIEDARDWLYAQLERQRVRHAEIEARLAQMTPQRLLAECNRRRIALGLSPYTIAARAA